MPPACRRRVYRHRLASAEVTLLAQHVGSVAYRGVLTAPELAALAGQIFAPSFDVDPVWVVDFRRATPTVSAQQLLMVARALPEGVGRTMALLVPHPFDEVFREFAWEAARFGLLRAVFTAPERAQSWATMQSILLTEDQSPASPADTGYRPAL